MSNLETKWKIKFYLEARKNSGEEKHTDRKIPIYMYVTFGRGQRLQFYTRESVYVDQIDEHYLKRVKEDRHYFRPIKPSVNDSRSINGRFEKIAQETVRLIEVADKSDPPVDLSAEYLKSALKAWIDKDIKPSRDSKGMSIAEAMDEYKIYSAMRQAPKTQASFKQVRDNIEAYIKTNKYAAIYLADIDQSFIEGFENFLINKKVKDKTISERVNGKIVSTEVIYKNLSNNTYAKNLKVLRAFLNWVKEKGWYENNVTIRFKENEGAILFLTIDELTTLQNAKFINTKHERLRDIFVFGVFTGLRYGDLKALKKNDFRDGRIWFYEQKNKATIERNVKLMPKALAIVEKYKNMPGDLLLPAYSNPNKLLKEVFTLAKIERLVTIVHMYAGGKTEEIILPLSKVAHSHMERKTFITTALTLNMPPAVVRANTGHSKNSKAFNRYYNIIDSVKDDAMDATFGKL